MFIKHNAHVTICNNISTNDIVRRIVITITHKIDSMVIIAVSDEVPSNTFSASKRLNSRTRDHLRQVLIEMSDNPEGRAILDDFGAQRFISTTRDDFNPVFNMLRSMKIDLADPLYAGQ